MKSITSNKSGPIWYSEQYAKQNFQTWREICCGERALKFLEMCGPDVAVMGFQRAHFSWGNSLVKCISNTKRETYSRGFLFAGDIGLPDIGYLFRITTSSICSMNSVIFYVVELRNMCC